MEKAKADLQEQPEQIVQPVPEPQKKLEKVIADLQEQPEQIVQPVPETQEKPEKPAKRSTFLILDEKRTIRLQGAEYQYEAVTGGGMDSLTVIAGQTEIMLFDRDGLDGFIGELTELRDKYFGEARHAGLGKVLVLRGIYRREQPDQIGRTYGPGRVHGRDQQLSRQCHTG
jgi:hypothetical protein